MFFAQIRIHLENCIFHTRTKNTWVEKYSSAAAVMMIMIMMVVMVMMGSKNTAMDFKEPTKNTRTFSYGRLNARTIFTNKYTAAYAKFGDFILTFHTHTHTILFFS